jgi:long-chain acyl-CoA synthetase
MSGPPTILLTGTGTLGRELLLVLLRTTAHRIAMLMRDRGRQPALVRAEALFARLELTAEERARVEVVAGDVVLPDLGLAADMCQRLTRHVHTIVHTAAVTSLTADRVLCETVNVGGTVNVLRLAARAMAAGALKRFVHVSTALVAGSGSHGLVGEGDLSPSAVHSNHYEWSKYDGERVVRAAMRAGLPAVICRPGMVVGETQTGRTRDFHVIYPLIRLMAAGHITRFPATPSAAVHLAPIDFVVDGIARAIDTPWAAGETFHLTAPVPPTVAELFACDAFFPRAAARPRLVAPEAFDLAGCDRRERDLLESVSFCFPYFDSRLSFDTQNAGRLVALPVTDGVFLDRLGHYAVESGYLRQARE